MLPILPTTPFVILAAFAFSQSSPRIEAWLLNSRFFGRIIADWRTYGTIAPRYKAIAVAMMGAASGTNLALNVRPRVLVVQAICIFGAAVYVLTRPDGPDSAE